MWGRFVDGAVSYCAQQRRGAVHRNLLLRFPFLKIVSVCDTLSNGPDVLTYRTMEMDLSAESCRVTRGRLQACANSTAPADFSKSIRVGRGIPVSGGQGEHWEMQDDPSGKLERSERGEQI